MGEIRIKEIDLYVPVRDFLEKNGYKVRGEVKECDIAAMKGETLLIVELKKNLSVELLVQGINRQKIGDIVYIAIPKPKKLTLTRKWKDLCHLIRRLELGLLLVTLNKGTSFVEEAVTPEPLNMKKAAGSKAVKKRREKLIGEFNGRSHDLNKGGSTGKKIITAFREASIYIACCLEQYGALSPKELKELGTDEKKTGSILYSNHYGWFERPSYGKYALSEKGIKEIELYPELYKYYSSIIEKKGFDNTKGKGS